MHKRVMMMEARRRPSGPSGEDLGVERHISFFVIGMKDY